MRKGQVLLSVFLAVLITAIIATMISLPAGFVIANATGPLPPATLTTLDSSRLNSSNYNPKNINAQAGNISRIEIDAWSGTKNWAGFYGNVSGTIVLQDARNHTMYDWTETEPKGEVYATPNQTINWGGMECFNLTANSSGEYNATMMEAYYHIDSEQADGIDETFNTNTHPAFAIGTVNIAADTCPDVETYVSSASQTTRFHETLLIDGTGRAMVFATIMETDDAGDDTDVVGFDGETHDFQMIVLEDGSNGYEDTVTPYYFYVEIGN